MSIDALAYEVCCQRERGKIDRGSVLVVLPEVNAVIVRAVNRLLGRQVVVCSRNASGFVADRHPSRKAEVANLQIPGRVIVSADVNNKQNPVLLFARPDAPPRIDEQVRRFYIAVHNLALMEMTQGENDASRIKLDATESCGGIMRAAWRVALRL